MVKKLLPALLAALLCGSCGILYLTPFPSILPLAEKSIDLSGRMPEADEDSWDVRLALLNGYLFLTVKDKLAILDSELKVLKEYDGQYGRLAVYNGTDYFIGREQYGAAPGFSHLGTTTYAQENLGYYDPGAPPPGVVTLSCGGGSLYTNGVVGPFSTPMPGDLNLGAALADDLGPSVFLFFKGNDSEEGVVVKVDRTLIRSGTLGAYPFGVAVVDLSAGEEGRFFYTHDGFVCSRDEGRWLIRYGFDGSEKSALTGRRMKSFAAAFDLDGATFYLYDGGVRRLYKCRTWW